MANRSDSPKITPQLLLRVYAAGMFPMAQSADDPDIHWVEPEMRGILPLNNFHLSRSLAKTIRQDRYRVTVDQCFNKIVDECAKQRASRPDTWINDRIKALYAQLHEIGHAHSLEVWDEEKLVGGLYGVKLASAFFGESMFSTATNASKVALAHLVARLRLGGFILLDTQFITSHLQSLGAVEIPQSDYLQLLDVALEEDAKFYPEDLLNYSNLSDRVLEVLQGTDH